MRFTGIFAGLMLCAFSGPAYAAPEAAAPDHAKIKEQAEKVFAKLKEIGDGLEGQEEKHFQLLYANYTLVNTVDTVDKRLDVAVEACAGANPDMKEDLDGRLAVFREAVKPVLGEARGQLENMIIAQDYVAQDKLRGILSEMDGVREDSEKIIDKEPVTTADACGEMIKGMDQTQATMIGLLRQTLVSFPKVMKEEEPAIPEEEPAKEAETPAADSP